MQQEGWFPRLPLARGSLPVEVLGVPLGWVLGLSLGWVLLVVRPLGLGSARLRWKIAMPVMLISAICSSISSQTHGFLYKKDAG